MAWIQTVSGRMFDFEQCVPEDIYVEDIAHALSNTCRFGGHLRDFYSVAQHSVHVAERAKNQKLGLMHDGSEAYIHDVTRPLKKLLGYTYAHIENRIMQCVYKRYDVQFSMDDKQDLHIVDMRMLVTEAMQLHPKGIHSMWDVDVKEYPPYPLKLVPWPPRIAKENFLMLFTSLFGKKV